MTKEIESNEDIIDTLDLVARIEDLEGEQEGLQSAVEEATEELEKVPLGEEINSELKEAKAAAELALAEWNSENLEELTELKELAKACEYSPDFHHGEQIINDNYFATYIERLIDDCYDMPKEMNSNNWPWRHMTLDLAAAAEEAKSDYTDVYYYGNLYWIRS